MRRTIVTRDVVRVNKHCAHYPCHSKLGDCAFCYCPYYPCGDERLGSYVKTGHGKDIWSCKDCNWIHDKKVVDGIFELIRSWDFKERANDERGKFDGIGVIILGHGSRLKKANDSLVKLSKKIRSESGIEIVETAFLQLCRPYLNETIERVVKKGCKKVVVVPYFLFVGNHVTRDIPKIIAEEAKRHKGARFIYAKNLGQDRRMENIVMDRIREAVR